MPASEPFDFPGDDREYLTQHRMITVDANGREVLVGLTHEETLFYAGVLKGAVPDDYDRERWAALANKHTAGRMRLAVAQDAWNPPKPPQA